jgi:hypothetical protein
MKKYKHKNSDTEWYKAEDVKQMMIEKEFEIQRLKREIAELKSLFNTYSRSKYV